MTSFENTHPSEDIPRARVGIVGAGPIGLELAVTLKRMGIDYLHFEARQIGHTFTWWPRNTYFFSTTERLEIAGLPIQDVAQGRLTGEAYLAYLRAVVEQFDLQINTYEPVVGIWRRGQDFLLRTHPLPGERSYLCEKLVLAVGDMDGPNLLHIPGEDLPHVTHYFTDPHFYFRKRLLVVGGRNSALEAALRCWRAGGRVTISYRRAKFDPQIVKGHLLPDVETQIQLGTIGFLPETTPAEITPEAAILHGPGGSLIRHPTDFVLLATGFVADTRLFELAGVSLVGEGRAPEFDPQTMETGVPGLYVAGTAAAGTQTRYRLFVENAHEHVGKIVQHLTGKWPEKLGTIPERAYEVKVEEIEAN